jgi:hypothetical protein
MHHLLSLLSLSFALSGNGLISTDATESEGSRGLTRITVIDCQTAGISGNMLLAALIDAGADRRAIERVLEQIPRNYPKCRSLSLDISEVKTHGFRACGVNLRIDEDAEETRAEELLGAVQKVAAVSGLSEKAASFAINSIRTLLEAESKLHGVSLSSTHLHEAGSADTLADVLGVAVACDSLGIFDGETHSTPVAVGGGITVFSHGKLTTPVPAVLEILRQKQIPITGGPEAVELSTPTGVCMLANLVESVVVNYPTMISEKVGYGAGTKELPSSPNILRVVIGRSIDHGLDTDTVQILETNIDDLSGEVLGHALQHLLDSGARDAWISAAQFKKNRPGHVLHVLSDSKDVSRLVEVMMQDTGTLGVRYHQLARYTSPRDVRNVKVRIGRQSYDVRVKFARDASGRAFRVKPEFDDIVAIAKTLSRPVREISDIVISETRKAMEETGEI